MTPALRETDVSQVVDMDAVIVAIENAMPELGQGTARGRERSLGLVPFYA